MKKIYLLISIIILVIPFFLRDRSMDTSPFRSFGKEDAPHHIIVFEEFACHACRRFHLEDLPILIQNYVDTGKAKITLIPMAYLDASLNACQAILCLEELSEKSYLLFIDQLFQNPIGSVTDHISRFQHNYPDIHFRFRNPQNVEKLLKMGKNLCDGLYESEIHLPTILIDQKQMRDISLESIERVLK